RTSTSSSTPRTPTRRRNRGSSRSPAAPSPGRTGASRTPLRRRCSRLSAANRHHRRAPATSSTSPRRGLRTGGGPADGKAMARLSAFVPRLVALTLIWLLATAALTYAAGRRMAASVVKPLAKPPVQAQRRVLVVPDVRRQAYVFAKGILGDAGFAWKV